VSQFTFVGGTTKSPDWAPAQNPHGFIYAISSTGDWMWGHFFYNVSYAVSEIDGMHMSQNGTYLTCLGLSNTKPILMNLEPKTGQIKNFYTLDAVTSQPMTAYLPL